MDENSIPTPETDKFCISSLEGDLAEEWTEFSRSLERRLREAEIKLDLERAEHRVTEGLLAAELEISKIREASVNGMKIQIERLQDKREELEAENKRLRDQLNMLERTRNV